MEKIELEQKIIGVIERIKPALQADGGSIEFVNFTDDNVVNVRLLGACGCCPYSLITLKQGVETAIKEEVPSVKSVEAVN